MTWEQTSFDRLQPERLKRYLVRRLQQLGWDVALSVGFADGGSVAYGDLPNALNMPVFGMNAQPFYSKVGGCQTEPSSVTVNVLPASGRLSTCTSPPYSRASFLTIESPSPLPRILRVLSLWIRTNSPKS